MKPVRWSVCALLVVLAVSISGGIASAEPLAKPDTSLDEALGKFDDLATHNFPGHYGGMWIEPGTETTDGIHVGVVEGDRKIFDRLQTLFEEPGLLTMVPVETSIVGLRATQSDLLDFIRSQDGARVMAEGGSPDVSTGIDRSENQVIVLWPGSTKSARSDLESDWGEAVDVRWSGPSGPECSDRFHCGQYLRAGLEIRKTASQPKCSTSFTVLYNGVRQLLSAGHCGSSGTKWYHTGTSPSDRFGSTKAVHNHGIADVSRISVGNGFSAIAKLYRTHSDNNFPVLATSSYSGVLEGSSICKSGAVTHRTCGVLLQKDFTPWWVPLSTPTFFRTDFCAQIGDSGAAVYRAEYAAGVHSGGSDATCSSSSDWSVFTHIVMAQWALGASIVYSP